MIYDFCHCFKRTEFWGCSFAKVIGFSLKTPNKYSLRKINMANNIYCSIENGGMESRGSLVVLEGFDRSGKSSECSRLVSYLEGKEISAELWRFLDKTTSVGQTISAYLANTSQMDDRTIHFFFNANRWEKRSLMETKLKSGTTLIVDRCSYSGWLSHPPKDLILNGAPEIGLLAPDLVLFLNISPEKATKRYGYGGERYEKLEFQKTVAESYKVLHDAS